MILSKLLRKWHPTVTEGYGDSLHLTFDDGPSQRYTLDILEKLDKHQQHATFFLIGELAEKHPDIVQQIETQGHSIGCHSQSHICGENASLATLYKDYSAGKKTLENILGRSITLFRPPYGYCNGRVTLAAGLLSMKVILWNCDPKDWIPHKPKSEILNFVNPFLKSGSIILLHDWVYDNPAAQNRSETIASLQEILKTMDSMNLKSQGL